jgi:hypothetical protein
MIISSLQVISESFTPAQGGGLTGLCLNKNECLLGNLEVSRQALCNYGIPQSLYPDKYSVFFVNQKRELDLSIEEQLAESKKKLT